MVTGIQLRKVHRKIKKDKVVESRIQELKRLLKKTSEDYQKKVYFILKEILELRKAQMENYGISSIANEKGVDLTHHQVLYIFGYEAISEYAHNKIAVGQIKLSTVLYIIRQNVRFREAEHQNKAIDMYLSGRLKTTELGRLSYEVIFDNVINDKEVERADKQLINISYALQDYLKTIRSKENLFSDRKTLSYIKNQMEKMIGEIDRIQKFGERLQLKEEVRNR